MTLSSIIVSKWVPNLIWQAYCKLFLYTYLDQIKNQSKFCVPLQPPRFTIHSLKFSMVHKMYGCPYIILKEINIVFLSVIICSIADNLINTSTWKERNKYYSVLIQKWFLWKETSTYWKFKDKIFKLFWALNQHNCCVIVLWTFLPLAISLLSEWSIDSTAVLRCKTSPFS